MLTQIYILIWHHYLGHNNFICTYGRIIILQNGTCVYSNRNPATQRKPGIRDLPMPPVVDDDLEADGDNDGDTEERKLPVVGIKHEPDVNMKRNTVLPARVKR